MKTLCYSVRLESLVKISRRAFKHNWSNARIGMELGMDAGEVLRLKQITGLAEAFKDEEFSKSWEPVYEDEPINEEL